MKDAELPDHVGMSKGGYACMSCGGAVTADGYSEGGLAEGPEGGTDDDDDEEPKAPKSRIPLLFMASLRGKRK